MTELDRQAVTDDAGEAAFVVVVSTPDDVWRQGDGRPGFAQWSVYEVEAAWDTYSSGSIDIPAPHSRLGPLYARAGSMTNTDLVADVAEAEKAAYGSVKWDGCVDWLVGPEGCMAHACDEAGLRRFLDAVALGYRLAHEQVREVEP